MEDGNRDTRGWKVSACKRKGDRGIFALSFGPRPSGCRKKTTLNSGWSFAREPCPFLSCSSYEAEEKTPRTVLIVPIANTVLEPTDKQNPPSQPFNHQLTHQNTNKRTSNQPLEIKPNAFVKKEEKIYVSALSECLVLVLFFSRRNRYRHEKKNKWINERPQGISLSLPLSLALPTNTTHSM